MMLLLHMLRSSLPQQESCSLQHSSAHEPSVGPCSVQVFESRWQDYTQGDSKRSRFMRRSHTPSFCVAPTYLASNRALSNCLAIAPGRATVIPTNVKRADAAEQC